MNDQTAWKREIEDWIIDLETRLRDLEDPGEAPVRVVEIVEKGSYWEAGYHGLLEQLEQARAEAARLEVEVRGLNDQNARLTSNAQDLLEAYAAMYTALEGIFDAIDDEGKDPAHHRNTRAVHRDEWPTLWGRIDVARDVYDDYR